MDNKKKKNKPIKFHYGDFVEVLSDDFYSGATGVVVEHRDVSPLEGQYEVRLDFGHIIIRAASELRLR